MSDSGTIEAEDRLIISTHDTALIRALGKWYYARDLEKPQGSLIEAVAQQNIWDSSIRGVFCALANFDLTLDDLWEDNPDKTWCIMYELLTKKIDHVQGGRESVTENDLDYLKRIREGLKSESAVKLAKLLSDMIVCFEHLKNVIDGLEQAKKQVSDLYKQALRQKPEEPEEKKS